ncbi:MAG: U32 family peptidase [Clostridiales Family XIII bacterium]|jgi:putative protease|nr:U32 family peptidase [Clostridiales Family XIII bacterium]
MNYLKPELLAPVGDKEKLLFALEYGADAVYFGGENFSLRASAGNFSVAEIVEAVKLCRSYGKKAYLTLNIYPHDDDVAHMRTFLTELRLAAACLASNCPGTAPNGLPDAFIVADPGVLMLLKEVIPEVGMVGGSQIHLSTQASVTSAAAAKFWYDLGVRRLILARELSLNEIAQIRAQIPDGLELEAFVHGAVCMAYSGRCLLSNYLNGRDSNRGDCSQPCRWNYALSEAKRPGTYLPVEEDGRGSYIMSANDLCMIEHLGDLIRAGVTSFKIEGRMKSTYYVATVVRAYRGAIDAVWNSRSEGSAKDADLNTDTPIFDRVSTADPTDPIWIDELHKASHRTFSTGFFYGVPGTPDAYEKVTTSAHDIHGTEYIRGYEFLGIVSGYDVGTGLACVEQRGKFSVGDLIEIFGPQKEFSEFIVHELYDENMQPIPSAPHAQQILYLKTEKAVRPLDLLRKVKEDPSDIADKDSGEKQS